MALPGNRRPLLAAGLLLLPIYLWLASNREWTWLQDYRVVGPWAALVAFLVISGSRSASTGTSASRRGLGRLSSMLIP